MNNLESFEEIASQVHKELEDKTIVGLLLRYFGRGQLSTKQVILLGELYGVLD